MPTYMESEIPTIVSTGNGNNGNGMFGNDGWWGIILIALLFGWGRGNGFGGYGGGSGSEFLGYELGKVATTNDIASGFNNSAVLNSLNDIKLSQANAINYNAQGFAGINSAISNATSTLGYNMLQGFNGVERGQCTLGYNIKSGFNTLGHQISDCCCATQRLIERSTCDLLVNQNANTQKIIDYMQNDKISSLQAENVALKGRISNSEQSAYIINSLREPCPVPAYVVPNPNCCYTPCGTNGFTTIQ
jgi:hypothetical protein